MVFKIREQVISHIYLFILYFRLVVFGVGLLDGSLLASQVMLLFCLIDAFYFQTVTADILTCKIVPGDLRSAEATPTGGPQTPSAEQIATPMDSATATASPPELDLPGAAPVAATATPTAQQVGTPVDPAMTIAILSGLEKSADV